MTEDYPSAKTSSGDILKIHTLGRFQVSYGGKELFEENGRHQKIGDLLMYFITNRGKPAHPETIMETLWPDKEYSNPRNVLKNMVYRIKKSLEDMQVPGAKSYIIHSHGGYSWNTRASYWLDIDIFENLCQESFELSKSDSFQAAEKSREALNIYLGHYLPECLECHWVMAKRQYYRRLFITRISELLIFQKKQGLFPQMAKDCEKALSIEDFDENFHLFYMEALLEEGNTKQALAHYEFITALNYNEYGTKPSPAMQRIYHAVKNGIGKTSRLEFDEFFDMFKDQDKTQGAFLCEPDSFRLFCRLERLRAERSGFPIHLGLFTLSGPDSQSLNAEKLHSFRQQLSQVLLVSLRKVDVISSWNENQFILLLPGLDHSQASTVMGRVQEAFKDNVPRTEVTLHGSIHPFSPLEQHV
ncbi:MAG: BTAD domain-containing putative transcriptional regulator [Bacillota bacterium]